MLDWSAAAAVPLPSLVYPQQQVQVEQTHQTTTAPTEDGGSLLDWSEVVNPTAPPSPLVAKQVPPHQPEDAPTTAAVTAPASGNLTALASDISSEETKADTAVFSDESFFSGISEPADTRTATVAAAAAEAAADWTVAATESSPAGQTSRPSERRVRGLSVTRVL